MCDILFRSGTLEGSKLSSSGDTIVTFSYLAPYVIGVDYGVCFISACISYIHDNVIYLYC